jgi:HSP20 family protein
MPELIIWKNNEIHKLRKDMDRMFDRLCGELGLLTFSEKAGKFPDIELIETDTDLVLRAEVPGLNPKDLEISIGETSLTIGGKLNQERVTNSKGYITSEQTYNSFSRTLKFPCRIKLDDVKASYKKGVLKITMPKCKGEKARALKIET